MAEKWAVATTAPDQLTAEIWKDLLRQEGILVRLEAGRDISFLGLSTFPCQLLVPESKLQEAQEILAAYQEGETPPTA